MVDGVPPISTQVSALAVAEPDAPAVTCEGRTLTRAELDSSTNRLARAYAELGVGVGDYVTIAMPNSLAWIEACLACWKLGAVPQPVSARLPDAEFAGILDLKPRALIVGRVDPRGRMPSVAANFDADGFLYLSDRRVDMFTVGGRNVYPAEIESALAEHPDILSCLVVGLPDDDLGQVPHALVQASTALDEDAIRSFLADRLAGYKVPRTVEFVDRPLRDDAGKARRSAVRDDVIERRRARARH